MIYDSVEEIIDAIYGYMDSHMVTGTRWGHDYYFYKPANTKYGPYQWLWDSGWHMIVNAYRDPSKSVRDIQSMFKFQQDSGFVPEMIFWGEEESSLIKKLGDRLFGYSNEKYTDITQMPMLPYALRTIYAQTDDLEFVKEYVPKMVKYFKWWESERDPDEDGLISIIHPWESGIDATPLYDKAHGVEKPGFWGLYPKFLLLLRKYKKKANWNLQAILEKSWFNVEDVGVCSVYADGWGVLADLAKEFDGDLAAECRKKNTKYENAVLQKCWDPVREQFISYYHYNSRVEDGISEEKLLPETVQSLFPLLLRHIPDEIQSILIKKIQDPAKFGLKYPIPSVSKSEPTFNPHQSRLLWRGPTWPCTTWLVMEGLMKHGHLELANSILDKWIEMYKINDIYEYHNPITGEGLGEKGLGMSLVIIDMLYRMNRVL